MYDPAVRALREPRFRLLFVGQTTVAGRERVRTGLGAVAAAPAAAAQRPF